MVVPIIQHLCHTYAKLILNEKTSTGILFQAQLSVCLCVCVHVFVCTHVCMGYMSMCVPECMPVHVCVLLGAEPRASHMLESALPLNYDPNSTLTLKKQQTTINTVLNHKHNLTLKRLTF